MRLEYESLLKKSHTNFPESNVMVSQKLEKKKKCHAELDSASNKINDL